MLIYQTNKERIKAMKRALLLLTGLLVTMGCMAQHRVPKFANIWARVQAYPAGTGEVCITSNDPKPVLDGKWGEKSEGRFTLVTNGLMTNYQDVVDGEFKVWANYHYFVIVQVKPAEGYECVGMVMRVKEDGNYLPEDYYLGDRAIYDKSPTFLNNTKEENGKLYDQPLEYIYETGVYVDVNSQRDENNHIMPDQLMSEYDYYDYSFLEEKDCYMTLHDMNVEKGHWDETPIEIYAIFKKKEQITMDESGQMIFSSKNNLRLQYGNGLEAKVVKDVIDGKAVLKKTDRIPANLGVLLTGEPGQVYTFDNLPKPRMITVISGNGAFTYNALLCEIYGFYPESEILYRFGNYDYGAGFYKVASNADNERDYLTMAIPGGTPPDFFTIEGFTTGINQTETTQEEPVSIFDLQGRRLAEEPVKGVYIRNGKKVVK